MPFRNVFSSLIEKLESSIYRILLVLHLLSYFASQTVFQVTPLSIDEWLTVMKFSIPVVLLDESLKFVARRFTDGKDYLHTVWGIVLMWAVFFALILKGPI